MKTNQADIIMQDKVFVWVAAVTGAILLIPLVATQFTSEVDWTLSDFVVMGILFFGMGSLFVLTARKVKKQYRLGLGITFLIALLYIWAELAVGVFTNIGS